VKPASAVGAAAPRRAAAGARPARKRGSGTDRASLTGRRILARRPAGDGRRETGRRFLRASRKIRILAVRGGPREDDMHTGVTGALRLAGILLAAIAVMVTTPAVAQKPPSETMQEVLIKATLLTFNDANVTGNYTVLHAKLSKPFRDQFPPEKLKAAFKAFHDNRIDFDIIAAKAPIMKEPAKVNDNGVLSLNGHFDTSPSQVHFQLSFIMSDGEWKAVRINVQLKKP
jgi:hypothetical protein